MIKRSAIEAKAREFVDTPFKDQHRMKGKRGGIDCIGLVLCAAEELGIAYNDTAEMRGSDYLNYPATGLNSFVLHECKKRLIEKSFADMKAGDVIVMSVPDVACHAAIVTMRDGAFYMVHAYNSGPRKVIEHILDFKWQRRICGVFSYPGVED